MISSYFCDQFRRTAFRLSLFISLFMICFVNGCSSGDGLDRREVKGKVTFQGESVQQGTITLFPKSAGPVFSTSIREGEYHFSRKEGAIPGEYRVEITGLKKTGKMVTVEETGMEPFDVEEVISYIPVKFNSASQLTLNVKEEPLVTVHDFLLIN